MLSRRSMLCSTLAAGVSAPAMFAASRKMSLSIHQNTSSAAGYRKMLEGWAKAGIRNVEITAASVDDFLKTDTLDAARRILADNGLKPVSSACGVNGLVDPNPNRAAGLDNLKRRCEMFAALGVPRTYVTTATTARLTADDYKAAPANVGEVADIAKQFNLAAMVEFVRVSTFISTLPTALKMIRDAARPNLGLLFDCYHFWSGYNKFEDLDALRPGDIFHAHFQDVPDMPRELLTNTTRFIPGDGVSPLKRILGKLSEKGYAGALSVELFLPKFQQADPYELAKEIRQKAEAVMRQAKVL